MAILIIDDDQIFLTVIRGIFNAITKETILIASSAAAGLDLLADPSKGVGCIFLDINMPDRDGLSFLRCASYLGYAGQIAISSGENDAIIRSAHKLGEMLGLAMIGVLKKPVSVEDCRAILTKVTMKLSANRETGLSNSELRLGNYRLATHFHPQIDVCTGECSGLEVLLRVVTPDGSIHGPGRLLADLKATKKQVDLACQVVKMVLPQVSAMRELGYQQTVSINVEAAVLEDAFFQTWFRDEVSQAGLSPSGLCIEVIEKSLPRDFIGFVEKLTRLRIAGFELSLDDFGTGASNFDLLRYCPFSEVKLDRSIIEGSVYDAVTRRFMMSTRELAGCLGLRVVGEGVEKDEELELVSSAGIPVVQGFMFSQPLSHASAIAFLQKNRVSQQGAQVTFAC